MAKILVADDNSNIQKMVGVALKDQGIDVVAVGNGEAAVRKISDVRPDLVLADVFMPVRNGYEVCRYVKENSGLSHIPVILLVGAFDPLDEQEAQRVGADGVLKKPFVPPDPLISMVKSALTRAGVSLGPAAVPVVEKSASPARTGADILSGGVAAKLPLPAAAKLPEAKLPEIAPEPIDDIPVPPPQVKIPEGHGPLAFGSLLDAPETEEEPPVFSSKPMIDIAAKHEWDEPKDVPEEEEEEEQETQGGWHPDTLEEAEPATAEPSRAADWRDQAFHGSSPAKSPAPSHWTPTVEKTPIVEAAQSRVASISAVERKPGSPFTSDAWASAMAAGVEQKLSEADPNVPMVDAVETEVAAPATPVNGNAPTVAASPAIAAEKADTAPAEVPESKPSTGMWGVVPESSWEAEAKRAATLASTWDSTPLPSPEETQDMLAYSAAHDSTDHADSGAVETSEPETASAYSGHFEPAHEASSDAESSDNLPQESVEQPPLESVLPPNWGNAWASSASVTPSFGTSEPATETPHETPETIETPAAPEHVEQASAPAIESEPAPVMEAAAAAEAARAHVPDMDELVTRVLGKMNPEVLQRVTQEILKPLIEAIVRDELNAKK